MVRATVVIRYPDAPGPIACGVDLHPEYGDAVEAHRIVELALRCEIFVLVDEGGHM